jgi:large subunit ribosomal protein L17
MRHGKSGRKLKRTASHRRATLASLCTALLRHKRITTTVAKAKEARMVAEKIITRARKAVAHEKDAPAAAIHARREVGRLIRDREVVRELFTAITEKVGTRPGGYTRVVRLGQRYGDGAEMAVLELVDFNTGQEKAEKTPAPAKRKKPASGGRAKKAVEKKEGAVKTARKPKTEKPSDKGGPSTTAQSEKS